MKSSTIKALAISGLALVAIAGVTIGATYAYFSDASKGNVHVAAGSLELKFERTGIKGLVPSGGELVQKEYDAEGDYLDLTHDDDAVAYSVVNAMPGFDATLRFRVTNNATVNFSYELSACNLVYDNTDEPSVALIDVLEITITKSDDSSSSFFAKDIPSLHAMNENLAPGATDVFTVELKIDVEVGNEIQEGSLDFDLQVNAVQVH